MDFEGNERLIYQPEISECLCCEGCVRMRVSAEIPGEERNYALHSQPELNVGHRYVAEQCCDNTVSSEKCPPARRWRIWLHRAELVHQISILFLLPNQPHGS